MDKNQSVKEEKREQKEQGEAVHHDIKNERDENEGLSQGPNERPEGTESDNPQA